MSTNISRLFCTLKRSLRVYLFLMPLCFRMMLHCCTAHGVICIAPHDLPLTARLLPPLSTYVMASINGPQSNAFEPFSRAFAEIVPIVKTTVKTVTFAIFEKYIMLKFQKSLPSHLSVLHRTILVYYCGYGWNDNCLLRSNVWRAAVPEATRREADVQIVCHTFVGVCLTGLLCHISTLPISCS